MYHSEDRLELFSSATGMRKSISCSFAANQPLFALRRQRRDTAAMRTLRLVWTYMLATIVFLPFGDPLLSWSTNQKTHFRTSYENLQPFHGIQGRNIRDQYKNVILLSASAQSIPGTTVTVTTENMFRSSYQSESVSKIIVNSIHYTQPSGKLVK